MQQKRCAIRVSELLDLKRSNENIEEYYSRLVESKTTICIISMLYRNCGSNKRK
ncbi:MAG: hypothetical protein GXY08_11735 [Ruminococcus sp.]|nr:hypothetical protein [Ruminococcus sp.]